MEALFDAINDALAAIDDFIWGPPLMALILFGGILGMLLSLGLLLPSLELTVRRIHDLGKPWFWLLISLVPFIGGIALLIWFCMPGETKANQWGEPVK